MHTLWILFVIYIISDASSAAPKQLQSWNFDERNIINKSSGIPNAVTQDLRNDFSNSERLVFQGPVNSPNADIIYFPGEVPHTSQKEPKQVNNNRDIYSSTSTYENNATPSKNNNNNNNNIESEDIDFSGSFTIASLPQTTNINLQTTTSVPPAPLGLSLYTICSADVVLRASWNLGSEATSGTYTFPNGTVIQYAQCRAVAIIHP